MKETNKEEKKYRKRERKGKRNKGIERKRERDRKGKQTQTLTDAARGRECVLKHGHEGQNREIALS